MRKHGHSLTFLDVSMIPELTDAAVEVIGAECKVLTELRMGKQLVRNVSPVAVCCVAVVADGIEAGIVATSQRSVSRIHADERCKLSVFVPNAKFGLLGSRRVGENPGLY